VAIEPVAIPRDDAVAHVRECRKARDHPQEPEPPQTGQSPEDVADGVRAARDLARGLDEVHGLEDGGELDLGEASACVPEVEVDHVDRARAVELADPLGARGAEPAAAVVEDGRPRGRSGDAARERRDGGLHELHLDEKHTAPARLHHPGKAR
jgi:hypothetical protein